MYRMPEKKKTSGKSNVRFRIALEVVLSECKSPTLSLTFHQTEISWLFYAFSICFVSFYIIFVKVEFFHVNLRGNVVFTTTAIRIYFAALTLILYTYFN